MESLILGEESLEIIKVAKLLEQSSSFCELVRRWKSFAQNLGVNDVKILELERQINLSLLPLSDSPREVMKLWKAIKGVAATLKVLHEALCDCGLRSLAELLENKFSQPKVDVCTQFMLQGQIVTLNKLLSQKTSEDTRKGIMKILQKHAISKQPINLIREEVSPCDTPKYYIQRTFLYKTELNKKVLNACTTQAHMFLLKNISRSELARMIDFKPIDFSGNQLKKVTVQFILLEHDDDYDRLLKVTANPIHVVQHRSSSLFWMKSSQKLNVIREFVKDEGEILNEPGIIKRITSTLSPLSLCIAESPGMGKTFVLAHFASQVKAASPNALVLLIVLQEFIQHLKNLSSSTNELPLNIVASYACSTSWTNLIVQEIMKNDAYTTYLFLDGYDEINQDHLELADLFLKQLNEHKNVKIILTTRPHMKHRVEAIFNQLSYEILPFNEKNQINFLTKYWVNEYGATSGDILEAFSRKCLKSLEKTMTDTEKEIAGIPLQCKILAEVYAEDAKRASTLEHLREDSVKSITFFEMYKELVKTKFRRIEDLPGSSKNLHIRRNYWNAHVHASIVLLFPEWIDQFKPCLIGHDKIDESVLYSIGLMEKSSNIKIPRFLHRTFAEYILAGFLVGNLTKHECCIKFLFDELLGQKGIIAKDLDSGLRYYELKHPVIAYFVDLHLGDKNMPDLTPVLRFITNAEDATVAACACCKHNLENCFDLTTKILDHLDIKKEEGLRDSYFKSLPHVAVMWSKNVSLLEKLLKFTRQQFGADPNYHVHVHKVSNANRTPLHHALLYWDYNVVSFLLKEYADEIRKMGGLIHYLVLESGNDTESVIDDKLITIDLLFKLNPEWLTKSIGNGWVPILSDNIHVQLLKRLVELGADINAYSDRLGTVLHGASRKGSERNFKAVVRWAFDNGFELIDKGQKLGRTPLMEAINNLKNLDAEVLQWFKEAGADFDAKNENGRSVLFYAIYSANSYELTQKVIEFGANVNCVDKWKGNPAFWIIRFVSDPDLALALLKLLESKSFNGFNQKNAKNLTPLELAQEMRSGDEELISYLSERRPRCSLQ